MAVERDARHELARSLGRLVNGEMTNDEFDDCYFAHWADSADAAVREIAEFGYSLYSSGVGAYRLRGWHAVSPDVKRMAERAILFLQSDREYRWPKRSTDALAVWASVPWCNGGIPLLIVVSLFTVLGFSIKDFPWGFLLRLWAVVVLFAAAAAVGSQRHRDNYERWSQAGYVDAWPFFDRSEYDPQGTDLGASIQRLGR
jgi:hypothetical protein